MFISFKNSHNSPAWAAWVPFLVALLHTAFSSTSRAARLGSPMSSLLLSLEPRGSGDSPWEQSRDGPGRGSGCHWKRGCPGMQDTGAGGPAALHGVAGDGDVFAVGRRGVEPTRHWHMTGWGSPHRVGVTLDHIAVESIGATLESGYDGGYSAIGRQHIYVRHVRLNLCVWGFSLLWHTSHLQWSH